MLRKYGPRHLSDEQLYELSVLRYKGWGHERLASHFEVQRSVIEYWCVQLGIEVSKKHRISVLKEYPTKPVTYVRNGFIVRRFTKQESRQILKWHLEGKSYHFIATKTKRKHNSIRRHIQDLARKEARKEEEEQYARKTTSVAA